MRGYPFRAEDKQFFADHPDRKLRLRTPFIGEYTHEFDTLGMHNAERERVIVARMPDMVRRQYGVEMMPIPMLLHADETVEDRDDILAPIFHSLMQAAGAGISGTTEVRTKPVHAAETVTHLESLDVEISASGDGYPSLPVVEIVRPPTKRRRN